MTMHKGDEEPVELTGKQSFVVGCGIGIVVLMLVALVVVWQGKKVEAERKARTSQTLEIIAAAIRDAAEIPRADGTGSDWSGQGAVSTIRSQEGFESRQITIGSAELNGLPRWNAFRELEQRARPGLIVDGWGSPVRYRCPGPVHKNGWDLWSCGPNGKDDQGTFDDILVGEDIASVTTR